MLKELIKLGSLAVVVSVSVAAHSQALPTAVAKGALQVGGGVTYAVPDYGDEAIKGVTIYADYDVRPHFGAEAEYHYISLVTPTDLGENSIFVGPRYILPRGRYNIYVKALFGIGTIAIQEVADNPQGGAGSYIAYGAGAGVDYRISKHLVIRGDAEYQHWAYLNGLTPQNFTVGVAYRFR